MRDRTPDIVLVIFLVVSAILVGWGAMTLGTRESTQKLEQLKAKIESVRKDYNEAPKEVRLQMVQMVIALNIELAQTRYRYRETDAIRNTEFDKVPPIDLYPKPEKAEMEKTQ